MDNSLRTIFAEALEIADAQQRDAYLSRVCGTGLALRREVEELILAEGAAGKFLPNKPAADAAPAGPGWRLGGAWAPHGNGKIPVAEAPGDRIGRYKLLQKIGEGGCGIVYMAEQEEPVRRRVALKVIKLGMDTKTVVARFEAERQAVALMDHPNIAKVLDAGATETGCPFFVMELVRGVKITDYCDQNNLPTHQRLYLFLQVCKAIRHAHQKGIIHRDIKPSNILVTLHDGMPVAKVIDFGIAKATTGQPLTDKTVFTAFEQFIGTPAYMSPEQAELSGLDIDARSDIYALGVLLYELLTGQTPFDAKELMVAGLDEMRRIIRTKDPVPPSTRLTSLEAQEQTTVAKRRQIEAPRLIHMVRGDLDWIVMKCLEKDRRRRYDEASSLAQDLERYLGNQPVSAAAPSFAYYIQKLFVRHRKNLAQVGIGALLALTVALATFSLLKNQRGNIAVPSGSERTFGVKVLTPGGAPIESASCRLVVGGYPASGMYPDEDNILTGFTDRNGKIVFRHSLLQTARRHALYIEATNYSGATRFLNSAETKKGALTIVLFKPLRVKLRYAFNPTNDLILAGSNMVTGNVTLYPMQDGSYRPPARAFFSFKQDKIVGGSSVLDVGIAIDQKGGVLYFGDSRGRFDHCTDIGPVTLESVRTVATNRLVRERLDTPIVKGHCYIFESNIYPPAARTAFTGFDVCYAKIFVESVEEAPTDEVR